MRTLIDYIFYRTYIAYKKKNDPALFNSSLYIGTVLLFSLAPFYGIFVETFRGLNKLIIKVIYFIYLIICYLYSFFRFYKKNKVNSIKYKNTANKYNKIIPTWLFFCILPLSMVLGIGSHILLTIHLVQKYNLEGYLYQLFFGK